MKIEGNVAIITGGASGLGEATTRLLHSAGAKVLIFDLNEEKASELITELGSGVAFHKCNVADEADVKAGIAKALDLGSLRMVYNAAGIGAALKTVGREGAHSFNVFKKIVEVNLFGTFNVVRLCAEAIGKLDPVNDDGERGVITNTASIAAYDGQQGQAAYAASKAGVVGMTLPIARDLARNGIRINTIAPGVFMTPMLGGASEELQQALARDTEFPKRLGRAEEIAALVKFLITDGYMNGETIRCDAATRLSAR